MTINIRNYELKDKGIIKQLFQLNNNEEDLVHILDSPRLGTAVVAEKSHEIIGAGFTWKGIFHRSCTYFRIIVDPFYQTNIVADKLLSALKPTIQDDFPLQTSLWETSVGLTEFYERSGFQLTRKTFMPELQISNGADWLQSKPNNDLHHSIMTLADSKQNQETMLELCALVKSNYEQTHTENPIAQLDLTQWKELILAENTMLDGSFLLLDEQQIVAYSLMHESEKEGRLELGWCGSMNSQWQRSIPLLILEQIKFASQHGYKTLVGEFDTTSPFAMEVLSKIPFPPCAAWVTYQK